MTQTLQTSAEGGEVGGSGVFAEASPCCPSPIVGQLMIVAYIIGGAFMYVWLFSMIVRSAQARYRRRASHPEADPQ